MKWNRRTKVVMLTALMAGIVIAIYLFGTMIPEDAVTGSFLNARRSLANSVASYFSLE